MFNPNSIVLNTMYPEILEAQEQQMNDPNSPIEYTQEDIEFYEQLKYEKEYYSTHPLPNYNTYNQFQYQQQPNYNQYNYQQSNYNQYQQPNYNMYGSNYQQQGLGGSYYAQPQQYQNQGGYNNNFYNPYLYRQQYEAYQAEMKEQYESQLRLAKKITRAAHSAIGEKLTDEQLDEMYNPKPVEISEEEIIYQTCCYWDTLPTSKDYDPFINDPHRQMVEKRFDQISQAYQMITPKDMGLIDFLNCAGTLYIEALLQEQKRRDKNLNCLFDAQSYKERLRRDREARGGKNSLFGTIFISYDDALENDSINVPGGMRGDLEAVRRELERKKDERRDAFMQAILAPQPNAYGV